MAESTFEYLRADFEAQKAAFIQRVRSRFPGVWNDFSQGSLGSLIIDISSWALSTTAYTQNRLAAENFTPTMQLRESIVRFSAPFGYKLRGATPATVPCTATLASVIASDVLMPRGTPVRSGDLPALTFELVTDYVIMAGDLTPLAVVATFDPALVGTRNIAALVSVVSGSTSIDCLDATADLRQLVQVGQAFRTGPSQTEYGIVSIEVAPGAASYNRLVIDPPWADATTTTSGEIVDRRVVFVQGQTQTERFVAPADPAAFLVKLAYSSVIDGSVEISINGAAWTEVRDLALAEPTQEAFQVRTLATGETIVAFGDGLFGAPPPAQASIVAVYRTGGGPEGNVASGKITTSVTGIIASLSNPVTIIVANRQPGSGGLAPESLSEARARIPAFIRTQDRAVTRDDYQTLAVSYSSPAGQVRFARATVRTQNALLEGNVVVLYAWTTGVDNALVPLSSALKASLREYLQTKAVGTDYVLIADGEATQFPLACRFKAVPGYDVAVVEDNILAAASKFVTALEPGAIARYSQLVTTLAAVPGVFAITIATPDEDVRPASDKTVFAPPVARPFYAVVARSTGGGLYTAQAPSAPLAAWGLTARLNSEILTVTPDTHPGFARLTGTALSQKEDEPSRVNLQTGLVEFYTTGPVASFEIGFVAAQGYSRDRTVDIYAGYTGDNSLAKRREIRSAIRAWAVGTPVGAPLFADRVTGTLGSTASVRAVIEAVPGVLEVTQVAFDAPANTTARLDVSEWELAVVRNVFLNSAAD